LITYDWTYLGDHDNVFCCGAAAFNTQRDWMVYVGGWGFYGGKKAGVFSTEIDDWLQLNISGVPPDDPGYSRAIWDPNGHRALMFGGGGGLSNDFNHVFELVLNETYQETILHEDFEDDVLDSRISIETIGTFNYLPGIKDITNFGSTKAFGYGRSTCGSSCFDNYVTNFKITFPQPTMVTDIIFNEMELYGNWGSKGKIYIDGVALTWGTYNENQDFGREPTNDGIPDSEFETKTFTINQYVTTIELKVADITSSSEIFIDDIYVFTGTKMDIKVFLEGPYSIDAMMPYLNSSNLLPLNQPFNVNPWNYDGTESVTAIPNNNIIDWILVEIRDTVSAEDATSNTIIGRQAAFLLNDGSVVNLDGANFLDNYYTISNNLFIAIYHRNHLGIMSANPLTETEGVYSYDFSSSSSQTFSGTMTIKELAPGVWGMIATDGNADGEINLLDKEGIWEQQSGENGYKLGDFNLDGEVNNPDKDDFWVPNEGKSCQIPE
jgi:hypothetical protein